MTFKFNGWPWKTIEPLFCATSNFVCHFIAIGEFKLELQSGKTQFGSKSTFFFVLCDLEIWRMTLKNNRAPLLCCFKLCSSFHSHHWIQTGVTVGKHPIWVKIGDFLSRVTLKFDGWPWKTIGHLFYATSSFMHHCIAIGQFKLESGNAQIGAKFVLNSVTLAFELWPWPLACTSLLSMVITSENFMMIWWWKHCEKGVTDGQTDGRKCS